MEAIRGLLTTYAYNICGSLEDARDIVQDAYLQFMRINSAEVRDAKAYLVRTVINLSINLKQQRQKQLTNYPGNWLPEPVVTEAPDVSMHRRDVLSYSLLVLLEKLGPLQRAVFILKEAFDYEHTEIAAVLDITPEHSRQLLRRGRKLLETPRPLHAPKAEKEFLQRYLEVIRQGDTQRLEQLLHEDVSFVSDGGGKVTAGTNIIYGKPSVMAIAMGIYRKFYATAPIRQTIINHQPALLYYEGGQVVTCQVFTLQNGRISNVYTIRNPDKLASLQKKS